MFHTPKRTKESDSIVPLASPLLSLPPELRILILKFVIGGHLLSVSVRDPRRLAHVYGTWSHSAKLKLESCRLNPSTTCRESWEDGERCYSDNVKVRSLEADNHYVCQEYPK